jgi:biotin transport system substrate-specific component
MDIKNGVSRNIIIQTISNLKTNSIFWIISFSVLTAISAQVAVPVKPVPFTLQTMIVMLAGAFLGAKNGAYSQLFYLFLGSIGFPVFANGSMGIGVLFGPTGGYLLAFPIAAYIVGYFVDINNKYFSVVFSMFISEIIIISLGVIYLDIFFINNFFEALKGGAAIFSVWMVIKVFAASAIYFGISKKYSKLPV